MVKVIESGSFRATVDTEIPYIPLIDIRMPDVVIATEFSVQSGVKSWADVLKEDIDKLYTSVHAFIEEAERRGEGV